MTEVTAAILIKEKTVLLAKRKQGKHLAGYWELPGGKIEEGEDPSNCLKRELAEEFGITTKVGDHFMDSDYHYDHISIKLKAYFVKHVSGTIIPVDHDTYEWVPISELTDYQLAPADIPIIQKLQQDYANK